MIKCPNCGEIIKEKKSRMNFCGYCGTNLKTGEKSWVPKETTAPEPPAGLPDKTIFTAGTQKSDNKTDTIPSNAVSQMPSKEFTLPQTTSDTIINNAPAPASIDNPSSAPVMPDTKTESAVSQDGNFSDIQSSIMMSEVAESIAKDTDETQSAPISDHKTGGYLSNVKMRRASEDNSSEGSSLTYMEYTRSTDTPEEETKPEPEKAPETVPEPDVPKTELISSYFGQDKLTVENMLRFKGFVVKSIYVTNDAAFDSIVDQSITAGTEAEIGSEITLSVSAGTWSDWKDKLDINVNPQKYIIEKKEVFRSRVRKRTMETRETNDLTGFQDYAVIDTKHKYSEWKTDTYYTSETLKPNELCEVISKASGFKYAGWFNPSNPSGLSFSSPDLAKFFNASASDINWEYDEVISEYNVKPDVKNWRLVNDSMTKTPAGDSLTSNIFLSTHIIGNKAYAMKFGSVQTQWYIYKRRSILETTYQIQREVISGWSEWSSWSDQKPEQTDDSEIQAKTLCRSRYKNSQEL